MDEIISILARLLAAFMSLWLARDLIFSKQELNRVMGQKFLASAFLFTLLIVIPLNRLTRFTVINWEVYSHLVDSFVLLSAFTLWRFRRKMTGE